MLYLAKPLLRIYHYCDYELLCHGDRSETKAAVEGAYVGKLPPDARSRGIISAPGQPPAPENIIDHSSLLNVYIINIGYIWP